MWGLYHALISVLIVLYTIIYHLFSLLFTEPAYCAEWGRKTVEAGRGGIRGAECTEFRAENLKSSVVKMVASWMALDAERP